MFYNLLFPSIREIPISCRFAILVARRVLYQIGYEILKNILEFYDVCRENIRNKCRKKIKQTFLSLFDFIKIFYTIFLNNSYNLIINKILF